MKSLLTRLTGVEKIAIFGGTFDPLHNGHISAALAVLDEFWPLRVLFVPTGAPPHKPGLPVTPPIHRYRMTQAGICTYPYFDCTDLETTRPGPSYTIDTVSELSEYLSEDAEIILIVGADMAMDILNWKQSQELLGRVRLAIVTRPGVPMPLETQISLLTQDYGARITKIDAPGLEISGTHLRQALYAGKNVQSYLPAGVYDYTLRHSLYAAQPPNFDIAFQKIKARLSPTRFLHTCGVIDEAQKLARTYNVDESKARFAALMHDACKEFSHDKMRALAHAWHVDLDEITAENIDMSHAQLAAHTARREFFCNCPEIFDAIACHTTGKRGMSMLAKVLSLADYIEPHREPYPPLKKMRRIAYQDINRALAVGILYNIEDLRTRGKIVHPNSVLALEELSGLQQMLRV